MGNITIETFGNGVTEIGKLGENAFRPIVPRSPSQQPEPTVCRAKTSAAAGGM